MKKTLFKVWYDDGDGYVYSSKKDAIEGILDNHAIGHAADEVYEYIAETGRIVRHFLIDWSIELVEQ